MLQGEAQGTVTEGVTHWGKPGHEAQRRKISRPVNPQEQSKPRAAAAYGGSGAGAGPAWQQGSPPWSGGRPSRCLGGSLTVF